MINRENIDYQNKTINILEESGVVLNRRDKKNVEIVDFGLKKLEEIGLQIITYINTERVCAKELVLFPYQTCPEHMHPNQGEMMGKEETFRCRKGEVFLYVEGKKTKNISAKMPKTKVTVFNEIILREGEQYTIYPNTLHWFQAGSKGAIISEFSTKSTDELDIFTDERIQRIPVIE